LGAPLAASPPAPEPLGADPKPQADAWEALRTAPMYAAVGGAGILAVALTDLRHKPAGLEAEGGYLYLPISPHI